MIKKLVLSSIILLFLPVVIAANTTTYYDRWHINDTFGLHTGTDPDTRFGNWSDRYNGTEDDPYLRAALFLEQENITVLNVIVRVSGGQDHIGNITSFLNTLDVNDISLSVILDYEPNISENKSSHLDSLRNIINETKKNATDFYPNHIGISVDYEWLDGIDKGTELNETIEEARNITVDEGLTFFPIWFEDDIRDSIVALQNKTDVIPLYDGLISSGTQIVANGSNSFFDTHVSHMGNNGFTEFGILPVSSEDGSLKKRQVVAAKTWIIYYTAALNQNVTYAIFASGNALEEDPLSIFTRDAIVDTQNLTESAYDLAADTFINNVSMYIYGMLPENDTTYQLHVVHNQSFSNQTSIPARVATFNTTVATNNRSFFVTEEIIPNPPHGYFDIIIDVDNDGTYDEGFDAIDDDDIDGAGFMVTDVLWFQDFSQQFQHDSRNITSPNNLSQFVNTSLFVDGVFLSYNGTNSSQRPFGKLFDDFSVLNFHVFNKTSNTKVDLTLTDDGYIFKGLNITYDYNNIGDDFIHLRHQTEDLKNGTDFTQFDYIGMKVNVDTANKHQMKFRITTTNETDIEDEVTCDTPFRNISQTGWIDFVASMGDLETGCNVSNVHMLSIFITDDDNTDKDTGNILIDEVYLRINTEYYVDDFEQYLLTDVSNWENTSHGTNVTIQITNTTVYNKTQSLNISYDYTDGELNFTIVQNDLPFFLDINDYEKIGFQFKADESNLHNVSVIVFDNDSISCEVPAENVTSTDWTRFEWETSELSGSCNLSFITRPAINISRDNVSDDSTGQVYMDNYFLKKNVTERIEFNFINESIRGDNSISWQVCLNTSQLNCSVASTFNYTQYLFNSAADFQSSDGNLTDHLNSLNRLQKNTRDFIRANLREQEILQNVIVNLNNNDTASAIINASGIDYTITNFTHNATNDTYFIVEHDKTNKGWGYYVYYPNAKIDDLIVSIPHPLNDGNTRAIGSDVYLNVSTAWLFLASAHRTTNFNELAEPVSDDNRQHPYYAAMLNVTSSSTRWLDIHGFKLSSHPGYPNVTISQGNSTQSTISLGFSANLSTQNITADVYDGSNYPDLAGSKNVIGKHIRNLTADFIHSEISDTVRNNYSLVSNYIVAAVNTFNPPDTTSPNLTINVPQPQNYTTGSFNFNVSLSENGSVLFALSDGENITMLGEEETVFGSEFNFTNTSIPDGDYIFYVFANDTSGNKNETEFVSFGVDTTPPNMTINVPIGQNYTNATINFNVSLSENGTVRFSLDGGSTNISMISQYGDLFGTEFNYTNASVTDGAYNFLVYANDTNGNRNETESISFEVYTVDEDGDNKVDLTDNLLWNESNVSWSGDGELNITVDGNATDGVFNDVHDVIFYNGPTQVLNFTYNFTDASLNLSRILVNISDNWMIVNLSGQTQSQYNKTMLVSDNNFVSICVKDAEIASIDEVTDSCTGADETDFTDCLGNSDGLTIDGITCTDTGAILVFENLANSAVRGDIAAASSSTAVSATTGGGSSSSTIPNLDAEEIIMETTEDEVFEHICIGDVCPILFDIFITDFDATAFAGHMFSFSYFAKGMAAIHDDVTINSWIEKDEQVVSSSVGVVYFGNFQEKTLHSKLLLPTIIEEGIHTLIVEVQYKDYDVKAKQTIQVEKDANGFTVTEHKVEKIAIDDANSPYDTFALSIIVFICLFAYLDTFKKRGKVA